MAVQQAIEKRKMERFDLELPAKLMLLNQELKKKMADSFNLQTVDISAGGALFYTDQTVPVGTEVKVDLTLPLGELKKLEGRTVRINISGSVVRSDTSGMAVSFGERYRITPLSK
jgi:c-di-GMP-binding flagellar brake protein YcgR